MVSTPHTPRPSRPAPPRSALPHPVTFFLTGAQRRRVLQLLRRHDPRSREAALLRALTLADRLSSSSPPSHPSTRKGLPHEQARVPRARCPGRPSP